MCGIVQYERDSRDDVRHNTPLINSENAYHISIWHQVNEGLIQRYSNSFQLVKRHWSVGEQQEQHVLESLFSYFCFHRRAAPPPKKKKPEELTSLTVSTKNVTSQTTLWESRCDNNTETRFYIHILSILCYFQIQCGLSTRSESLDFTKKKHKLF